MGRRAHRKSLLLGQIKTFSNDSRVDTFLDIPVRLLQQLSNEQNDRGCSISDLLVLGNSGTGDHSSGGVLRMSKVSVRTDQPAYLDLHL